ncbi:hypothetical protein ACBY01_11805 [Sphingomonas sp. ac-8]|uniref:hypothetical protein n=1 Tax=Sphingomonas sp. ac-8 TaxID=3242977 RepID=UPI003A7F9C91
MKLDNWVRVRLSESQMLIYATRAEVAGVPISTYLRDHLAKADVRQETLELIRATLYDIDDAVQDLRTQCADRAPASPTEAEERASPPNAVQIETLLLLRAMVSPQNLRMVTAELDRQGVEPWRGSVR